MKRRPGLEELLERLDVGAYDGMIVSRLDRLSRSVGDFATILDRANRKAWALVCLDPAVDLTSPYGKAMAHVAAAFAQLERELISQRTSEGIRAKVAAGERRLPQPEVDEAVAARIVALHGRGCRCGASAACWTGRASGRRVAARWGHTTIRNVLRRAEA
jgi:DNA invertase Pin-like site-specific DNA recombinase